MPIQIQRGTNISHWLSQSDRRGAGRAAFFTEEDVRRIARLGFDHIRIPIDEEQMWREDGSRDPEAFRLLDAALDWCEQHNLRAVVDLHILRTHHFISAATPRLFTDPAETQRFAGLWEQLSDHLCRRPVEQVAYELLNEAVASDPADWNRVAMAGFRAIRQREGQRTILLGSNYFNQTHTFDDLEIPQGDGHCILTYHYYRPMLITHYQAVWWEGGFYAGPVNYPGQPIRDEDMGCLNPEFLERVPQWSNEHWDRERMAADLAQPLAASRRTGYPLYCGEFGAYFKTPDALRYAWYRDMRSIFEEYGIGWANWDYKGGFAPVVDDGKPTKIVEILLG
jgi:endoglucanase